MSGRQDLPTIIITLTLAFVILFTGTFTVNGVIEAGDSGERVSHTVLLDGTTWHPIADDVGKNERVYNSLGNAINTTGADDSYWQSSENLSILSGDTWTLSVWARVDSEASSRTMTVVSADGRLLVMYNGSAGNWTAWYYDDGSRNSYQINVSAPDQPGNLTNVMVVRNGTNLTIYRNTTEGETADLSNTSSVDTQMESENWDGRIDEVRAFDDALNTTSRSNHHQNPVDPLPGTNRSARIMFDEAGRNIQLLFFASGHIETSNATYSDGLDGQQMDAGRFAALGADYKWDVVGPKIKPIEGGELEYAPVAYVDYNTQSRLDTLADDWNTAMALAGLLFLLLPLGVLVVYLRSAHGGR